MVSGRKTNLQSIISPLENIKHEASVCTTVVSRACTGSHSLSGTLACVLQMAGMYAHRSVAPGCVPPSPLHSSLSLFWHQGVSFQPLGLLQRGLQPHPQMFYPQFLLTFLSTAAHSSAFLSLLKIIWNQGSC